MNGTLRQPIERASAMIPAKDFFLAGLASLALHGLAFLLILHAVGLHATPVKIEEAPGMKISFVNLSSFPLSQARSSNDRPRKAEAHDTRKEAPGSSPHKIEDKQKKAPLTSILKVMSGKAAVHNSLELIPAGPDSRNDWNETALAKPTEELSFAGKFSGPALKSPEKGGISAPTAVQEKIGLQTSEGAVFSAASRYKQTPQPIYPLIARQRGYEGLVLIVAEILENGSAGQLRVKKSSGYAVLDQAALQAVKKWQFVPAVRNHIKIRTWGEIPIRFTLRESE